MFVAPSLIIGLMLVTMVVFYQALRQQQATLLEIVHGPLARATAKTTKLLLSVSEVQADVMRYARLRQRLLPEDGVLQDLRQSILAKYDAIDETFETVKEETSGEGERDVVTNIEDFLTIHRATSTRLLDGSPVENTSVSTVMAHYQQLQSYISELAERSLESAQATADQAELYVSRVSRYLLTGSILIILFSIAITLYMGRAISLPITEMIGILTSIATGKRIGAVPGQQRRDEIGAMARAVARFDDVTGELRDNERSLEEARRHAEAANAAKSAFLANVSHELRTPLTSILGFTRIIQRQLERTILPQIDAQQPKLGAAAQQVTQDIGIILSEGDRLTALINNLLDLEKIEAGQMTWKIEPILVSELIAQAESASASLHQSKGLAFETAIAPGLPPVAADGDRVMQVLVNLISNAVKFTSRGSIRCEARMRNPQFVEVSVADTGCGIAPQDQRAVFEKFRQVGDTLTGKPTGTGLGLAICKEVVEHLGGEIGLESEPGKGSRFFFTLPVSMSPQVAGRR